MSVKSTHSIYVLFDSRFPDVVKYVGRAVDPESRLAQHRKPKGRSKKDLWVSEVQGCGACVLMRIIYDGLSESEAIAAEKVCIKLMFSLGFDMVNTACFSPAKYKASVINEEKEIVARRLAMLTVSADKISENVKSTSTPRHKLPPRNKIGLKSVTCSNGKYNVSVSADGTRINSIDKYSNPNIAAKVADFIAFCYYDGDCYMNLGIEEFCRESMDYGLEALIYAKKEGYTYCPIWERMANKKQKLNLINNSRKFSKNISEAVERARKLIEES